MENCIPQNLRMIRFVPKKCVQERLARRLVAAAARLDRDKDGVDLGQLLGVVKAHHPPAI